MTQGNGQDQEDTIARKLRGRIFSAAKPKSIKLRFFGQEIEIRQPPLRVVMATQTLENRSEAAARMIAAYTYDPVTGEKVFDDGDVEAIMDLPFGEDLTNINKAIADLTGLDVEVEAKNLGPTQSAST